MPRNRKITYGGLAVAIYAIIDSQPDLQLSGGNIAGHRHRTLLDEDSRERLIFYVYVLQEHMIILETPLLMLKVDEDGKRFGVDIGRAPPEITNAN
jgi:hypothetical protein